MFERLRSIMAASTMIIALALVLLDPFTAAPTLPPGRLRLLLVFVGALLGVELFASWFPDELMIKLREDD
jgi:hypothetical protein